MLRTAHMAILGAAALALAAAGTLITGPPASATTISGKAMSSKAANAGDQLAKAQKAGGYGKYVFAEKNEIGGGSANAPKQVHQAQFSFIIETENGFIMADGGSAIIDGGTTIIHGDPGSSGIYAIIGDGGSAGAPFKVGWSHHG